MTVLVDLPPATGEPVFSFHDRGPLSRRIMRMLATSYPDDGLDVVAHDVLDVTRDAVLDDDVQLSLFLLYGTAYGSFGPVGAELEWDPTLLRVRHRLEEAFEAAVRDRVDAPPAPSPVTAASVADALFALTAPQPGPGLARDVEKTATRDQVRELLILRSIYTLREADPHSWAIPRLIGRPKAALVEIQSDEYGGGRPERMHAVMYADAMRGAGLDDRYAHYVDAAPAVTLAAQNLMSMFGMNRRLLGAVVGHLAAFEMTSSLPNRRYADGMRRVGFDETVTAYFDEHVEADAVHEQIAGRDLAGGLAEQQPDLVPDILFGAAACLLMDDLVADHVRTAWAAGRSALRTER
jgi:hypothetical protein